MKIVLVLSVLLVAFPSAHAQEAGKPIQVRSNLPKQPKDILSGPALTADEKTKIRFSAQVNGGRTPPSFDFRIYNGLRDKTLMGLVVRVATKNSEGQPVETDVFVSVDVPPLQTITGLQSYFVDFGNATREATFTLTEVLYESGTAPVSP